MFMYNTDSLRSYFCCAIQPPQAAADPGNGRYWVADRRRRGSTTRMEPPEIVLRDESGSKLYQCPLAGQPAARARRGVGGDTLSFAAYWAGPCGPDGALMRSTPPLSRVARLRRHVLQARPTTPPPPRCARREALQLRLARVRIPVDKTLLTRVSSQKNDRALCVSVCDAARRRPRHQSVRPCLSARCMVLAYPHLCCWSPTICAVTDPLSLSAFPRCTWRFSRSDELTRHMQVHRNDRMLRCHLCPKGFNRSDHLTKHLRSHTRKVMAETGLSQEEAERQVNVGRRRLRRRRRQAPSTAESEAASPAASSPASGAAATASSAAVAASAPAASALPAPPATASSAHAGGAIPIPAPQLQQGSMDMQP